MPDFRAMIDLVMRQGPQTGMVYERQKKNKERIHCSISSAPLRDADDKVIGVMVILEDTLNSGNTRKNCADQKSIIASW